MRTHIHHRDKRNGDGKKVTNNELFWAAYMRLRELVGSEGNLGQGVESKLEAC